VFLSREGEIKRTKSELPLPRGSEEVRFRIVAWEEREARLEPPGISTKTVPGMTIKKTNDFR
jgi:hypothetical protein